MKKINKFFSKLFMIIKKIVLWTLVSVAVAGTAFIAYKILAPEKMEINQVREITEYIQVDAFDELVKEYKESEEGVKVLENWATQKAIKDTQAKLDAEEARLLKEEASLWKVSPTALTVLHGISDIESGHRYDAIGNVTGSGYRAIGRYQVMEYNVGKWTQEHLGVRYTVQEFLDNPLAQDLLAGIIFTKRIGQYQNISDPVAIWFSGSTNNNRCDVNGTCTIDYVRQVLLAMR